MKILLDLYLTFFILGSTSFGGGYAMLPVLQRVVVERKKWVTEQDLADYFAIGQCTPGIIAVNVATFIGMKRKGIAGAIVATLGLVSPCIVIISIIAILFRSAGSNDVVNSAFLGLKVCVAVLIIGSAWTFMKKATVDKLTGILFYVVFSLMMLNYIFPNGGAVLKFLSSPIILVVVSGIMGLIFAPKSMKVSKKEDK
ncbi:MAG: chromate transporter [Clostridia bacterium]